MSIGFNGQTGNFLQSHIIRGNIMTLHVYKDDDICFVVKSIVS